MTRKQDNLLPQKRVRSQVDRPICEEVGYSFTSVWRFANEITPFDEAQLELEYRAVEEQRRETWAKQ